jgi:hypothetical protein
VSNESPVLEIRDVAEIAESAGTPAGHLEHFFVKDLSR